MGTNLDQYHNLIHSIENAVEQGLPGQAFELFETLCQEKEKNGVELENDPETLRMAAGLLLLRQCEINTANKPDPQSK